MKGKMVIRGKETGSRKMPMEKDAAKMGKECLNDKGMRKMMGK